MYVHQVLLLLIQRTLACNLLLSCFFSKTLCVSCILWQHQQRKITLLFKCALLYTRILYWLNPQSHELFSNYYQISNILYPSIFAWTSFINAVWGSICCFVSPDICSFSSSTLLVLIFVLVQLRVLLLLPTTIYLFHILTYRDYFYVPV